MSLLYYIKKDNTDYDEEIYDIEHYTDMSFQIIYYTEYSEKTINEISKNIKMLKTDCKEAAIIFAKNFNYNIFNEANNYYAVTDTRFLE